ncbi:MAG: C39 family peptidase [Patescibacteria group bacterium]|jgi:hypothetical protein
MLSLLTFLILSTKDTPLEQITAEGSVFLAKSEENIVLKVPFVHQIDDLSEKEKPLVRTTACGPAALTMLFRFHGTNVSLEEVIAKLPTTVYVKGQRFYNLYKGAEYFSMTSTEIEKTPKSIFETLEKGEPIILNVQNYDGITGHALVVVGMIGFDGEKASSLVVHDPFVGPYRVFPYASETTLDQPEGYKNYIGILNPFYVTEAADLLVLK